MDYDMAFDWLIAVTYTNYYEIYNIFNYYPQL